MRRWMIRMPRLNMFVEGYNHDFDDSVKSSSIDDATTNLDSAADIKATTTNDDNRSLCCDLVATPKKSRTDLEQSSKITDDCREQSSCCDCLSNLIFLFFGLEILSIMYLFFATDCPALIVSTILSFVVCFRFALAWIAVFLVVVDAFLVVRAVMINLRILCSPNTMQAVVVVVVVVPTATESGVHDGEENTWTTKAMKKQTLLSRTDLKTTKYTGILGFILEEETVIYVRINHEHAEVEDEEESCFHPALHQEQQLLHQRLLSNEDACIASKEEQVLLYELHVEEDNALAVGDTIEVVARAGGCDPSYGIVYAPHEEQVLQSCVCNLGWSVCFLLICAICFMVFRVPEAELAPSGSTATGSGSREDLMEWVVDFISGNVQLLKLKMDPPDDCQISSVYHFWGLLFVMLIFPTIVFGLMMAWCLFHRRTWNSIRTLVAAIKSSHPFGEHYFGF